jgi:hypothetical protein
MSGERVAGGTRAYNIRYSAAVGRWLPADFEFMGCSARDSAGHWLKALLRALPWIFVGVAPILMYHRVYIESGRNVAHFWGDTTNAYWPDLVFFTRSIAHGEFPLWNPNDRGGFPFAFWACLSCDFLGWLPRHGLVGRAFVLRCSVQQL